MGVGVGLNDSPTCFQLQSMRESMVVKRVLNAPNRQFNSFFFPFPPLQRIQMRSKPKRMLPQLHLQLQLELCIPCNSLVICVSLLAAAQPEKRRAEGSRAELSCSLLSESCQKYFALLLLGLAFSPLSPVSPLLLVLLVVLFVLFVTSDADVILLKAHTNKPKK